MVEGRIIDGYPDYIVFKDGRIMSKRRTKPIFLKPRISRLGYALVAIYDKDGNRTDRTIHRIVAETFVPNDKGFKEVNHVDGDKLNNAFNNIQWCTRSENVVHAFRTKLKLPSIGEQNGGSKLSEKEVYNIKTQLDKGNTYKSLAEQYRVSITAIYRIAHGLTWKHITQLHKFAEMKIEAKIVSLDQSVQKPNEK